MTATTKAAENAVLKDAMARVAADAGVGNEPPPPAPEPKPKTTTPKARTKPAAAAAAAAAPKPPKTHSVMYVPLEDDDSSNTVFCGMKFRANVPRDTANPELIKLASKNPWFSVDGKPPVKRPSSAAPRDTSEDVAAMEKPDDAEELVVSATGEIVEDDD